MIPMTAKPAKTKSDALNTEMETITVPRCDIGIAPENARANVPPDADIPNLAETLVTDDGCGQVVPLYVRRGKRSELPWMALDGSRRLHGFDHLLAQGRIENDHPVRITICETKEQIARATILLNTERLQPHPADSIEAIAKLLKKKMSPGDIARALNYKTSQMNKLMRLATVHPRVLEAFRANLLKERDLKLLARLDDKDAQRAHADRVLDGQRFDDQAVQSILRGDTSTINDPRFLIVRMEDYTSAGGRIEQDLFGEFDDTVLDTDLLDQLWNDKIVQVADYISETYGVEVHIASNDRGVVIPEGMGAAFSYLSEYNVANSLRARFASERAALIAFETEISGLVQSGDFDAARIGEYVWSKAQCFAYGQVIRDIGAVTLYPDPATGVSGKPALKPYVAPQPTEDEVRKAREAKEAEDAAAEIKSAYAVRTASVAEAPRVKVDVEGLNNSLHERRTDVATKGLMRDLADDPDVALTVLAARLFTSVATHSPTYNAAARINCDQYSSRFDIIPELDGEIRLRVRAWTDQYAEAGKRPISFVAGLDHVDRLQLIADLVGLSLDLREPTTNVNSERRADAAEITGLLNSDIRQHWTPDSDFLSAHPKTQLLKMAEELKLDTQSLAKAKKHELVKAVEEAAAEAKYAPAALDWSATYVEADAGSFEDDEDEADDEAAATDDAAPQVEGDGEVEGEPVAEVAEVANDRGAEQVGIDDDIQLDAELHNELDEDAMHFLDDEAA